MKTRTNRLSWGLAVSPTGTLVIRNWYLLFGSLVGSTFGIFLFVGLSGGRDAATNLYAFIGLLLSVSSFWNLILELRGVQVSDEGITYPVRLGKSTFPLFRRTLRVSDVLQASSLREKQGFRIAYLSGEFGQARLLFDTKGGRDRLFAILATRFPHIKIYRWT